MQVLRWIDVWCQDWTGLEVKVGAGSSELWLRVCGIGASGLRGWRFAIVDIYTGKGVLLT